MKLKLSERLQMMADAVGSGAVAADIGTDHGYLPIYLAQNKRCKKVILSDINSGPLKKAQENIEKYLPDFPFDLRQGSGISVLSPGDADTVIIAGMGGNLILDILLDDLQKTFSIARFILQPRNHPELLRRWVSQVPELEISRELLAEEDGRLCEIIVIENTKLFISGKGTEELSDSREVQKENDWEIVPGIFGSCKDVLLPVVRQKRAAAAEELRQRADVPESLTYELPLLYFIDQIPYGTDFLRGKIRSEEQIIRKIEQSGVSAASIKRLEESRERIAVFRRIEACVAEDSRKGVQNGRYRQN